MSYQKGGKTLPKRLPRLRVRRHRTPLRSEKSIVIAYLLWLFGGFLGLHHLYLRRDGHAFIWCCTLGGFFGWGWFDDMLNIPQYVRQVNNDSVLVRRLPQMYRPPFSWKRVYGQYLLGSLFGHVCQLGIPKDLEDYLRWCIPLSISFGVWLVGNIGRECGVWWHTGLATCFIYYRFYGEDCGLLMISLLSSCVFTYFSRRWRPHPQRRRACLIRFGRFIIAFGIYMGLWLSFLHFNAIIEIEPGIHVSVKQVFHYFLQSKWWTRFKLALTELWGYGKTYGLRKALEYEEGFGLIRGVDELNM
ncbi:hypothetical protein ACLKA7_003846 [Drosophila subpalustris]